jgi:DNA primase
MISPAKQIFHCFGCGAGGNVFGFVMKMENIDFPEAVRTLAEKAGVKLPSFTRSQFETSSYAVQIYKTNEMAAAYYRSMLLSTDAGKRAAAYLKNRGISEEAAKKAGLGFAPDEWSGLINYAKGKGVDIAVLERSGLVVPKEGGGHYDRFRNKIIFPIFDIKDRVVAFGARVLDNSVPKYINSPETEVYVKSRHLYGLNFSVKYREDDLVPEPVVVPAALFRDDEARTLEHRYVYAFSLSVVYESAPFVRREPEARLLSCLFAYAAVLQVCCRTLSGIRAQ